MTHKEDEVERLYGKTQGWDAARVFLSDLAVEKFNTGDDDAIAIFLRDLVRGEVAEKCLAAEDAWREADPNAVPRKL